MKTLAEKQEKFEKSLFDNDFQYFNTRHYTKEYVLNIINNQPYFSSSFFVKLILQFISFDKKDIVLSLLKYCSVDTLIKIASRCSFNYKYLQILVNQYNIDIYAHPDIINRSVYMYSDYRSFPYLRRKGKIRFSKDNIPILSHFSYSSFNMFEGSKSFKDFKYLLNKDFVDLSYNNYIVFEKIIEADNFIVFKYIIDKFNIDLTFKRNFLLNKACQFASNKIALYLLEQKEVIDYCHKYNNRALHYLLNNKQMRQNHFKSKSKKILNKLLTIPLVNKKINHSYFTNCVEFNQILLLSINKRNINNF